MPTLDELDSKVAPKKVTLDDLDKRVDSRATTPANKLFTRPTLPPTIIPGPEEFLGPIARGAGKGLAGIAQTLGDAVAPGTTDKLTAQVNKLLATPEGVRPGVEATGEFIGQALPLVLGGELLPEIGLLRGAGVVRQGMEAALKGGAAGALTYQEPTDRTGRVEGRALGAAGGAVLGGPLGAVGGLGTKLELNARQIVKDIRGIQGRFAKNDPSLADARASINQDAAVLNQGYKSRTDTILALGDKIGSINLSDTAPKLQALQGQIDKALNPDKKSTQIFDNLIDTLAPSRELPSNLTVGGRKFILDKEGARYVTPDGVNQLPPQVAKQILTQQGVAPLPQVGYRDMQGKIEELTNYLKDKSTSDPATDALRSARQILVDKLDSVKTDGVRRAEGKAQAYYDKHISKYDNPVVQKFLSETDPLKAANIALDAATSQEPAAAFTLASLLGNKGKDAVRMGLVKKALDDSLVKGRVDAVKFVDFFDKTPGAQPFYDNELRNSVKGIRNLLTETSQQQGFSNQLHIPTPHPLWGIFGAAGEAMRGNLGEAAVVASGALAVGPLFRGIERGMGSRYGQSLLSAAAGARPGSPRMASILQAFSRRFLPTTTGSAVGQGVGQQ